MRKPGDPTISTDAKAGETFLGRWARRKRGAVAEPVAAIIADESSASVTEQLAEQDSAQRQAQEQGRGVEHAPAVQAESAALTPTPVDEPASAAVLTDADMPDLASIGADDDYSGFMSPGVSEGLRNKALRQLFMSAQFNVLDGLNDYAEDYTSFEALGDIVTSDMRHRMEMAAEQAARAAEEQRLISDTTGQPALEEKVAGQQAIDQDGSAGEANDEDADEHTDEHTTEAQAVDTNTRQAHGNDESESARPVARDESATVDEQARQSIAVKSPRSDTEDV